MNDDINPVIYRETQTVFNRLLIYFVMRDCTVSGRIAHNYWISCRLYKHLHSITLEKKIFQVLVISNQVGND